MNPQLVHVETSDGVRLDGSWIPPHGVSQPGEVNAVVLVHGTGSKLLRSRHARAFRQGSEYEWIRRAAREHSRT